MEKFSGWFYLRLSDRFSIAPTTLHALWADALQTADVKVSRVLSDAEFGNSDFTYVFWARRDLADFHGAERRLRKALADRIPGTTIRLTASPPATKQTHSGRGGKRAILVPFVAST